MGRILAVLGMALVTSAQAQEANPIITERPGFSSSPYTVAPGVFQIESGYQYLRDDSGSGMDDHSFPLLLMRLGIADSVELQLNLPGYSWTDVGGNSVSGANDASVAVKWNVSSPGATVPVALFAALSLPVGDSEFTSDEVDPSLGAFWSYSGGLDWFGTVVINHSNDKTSATNAVGISFSVNQNTGLFVEYYGTFTENAGPEHYLDGGITFLASNDLQIDLNAGVGLNGRASDLFIGFGLGYRF